MIQPCAPAPSWWLGELRGAGLTARLACAWLARLPFDPPQAIPPTLRIKEVIE